MPTQFYNSFMNAKVGDFGKWAGESLNTKVGKRVLDGFTKTYSAKYMGRVGSFTPIVHIALAAGTLGYILEYSHLVHEHSGFLVFAYGHQIGLKTWRVKLQTVESIGTRLAR
eukprot:gene19841-25304_t